MRFALLLAYDGSDYHGFWRQPELRSIGAELDAAFDRLGESDARPVPASRTDAGVHARAQVAHVDCARSWQAEALQRAVDAQLPDAIACPAVAAVADDWHAARQALSKCYRYRLCCGRRDPHEARFVWAPPRAPDPTTLDALAAELVGEHDFCAFRRRDEQRSDTRCRIDAAGWRRRGSELHCEVQADRFVHHLVRSLVGAMVAVASAALPRRAWRAALAGDASEAARQQAPSRGLHLIRVRYAAEPVWRPQDPHAEHSSND